jgi:hypothetical protein
MYIFFRMSAFDIRLSMPTFVASAKKNHKINPTSSLIVYVGFSLKNRFEKTKLRIRNKQNGFRKTQMAPSQEPWYRIFKSVFASIQIVSR